MSFHLQSQTDSLYYEFFQKTPQKIRCLQPVLVSHNSLSSCQTTLTAAVMLNRVAVQICLACSADSTPNHFIVKSISPSWSESISICCILKIHEFSGLSTNCNVTTLKFSSAKYILWCFGYLDFGMTALFGDKIVAEVIWWHLFYLWIHLFLFFNSSFAFTSNHSCIHRPVTVLTCSLVETKWINFDWNFPWISSELQNIFRRL